MLTPWLDAAVTAALHEVLDPCSVGMGVPRSVLDMGLLERTELDGARLIVTLCTTGPSCLMATNIGRRATETLRAATGLEVEVRFDPAVRWSPARMRGAAPVSIRARPRQWRDGFPPRPPA